MTRNHIQPLGDAEKTGFHKVGECLYRLEPSGKYYALVKRGGKQFRRSLKTKDRKLAERRLATFRREVERLSLSEDSDVFFRTVADRWLATIRHTLKESSFKRIEQAINQAEPYFCGVTVRNVTADHCATWLEKRGNDLAAQTFAHELSAIRNVLNFAIERGILLHNPAKELKRKKIVRKQIVVPTREQFAALVAAIRQNDGRPDSQKAAKPGADLVELLAYSGMRLNEATELRYRDISGDKLTITGGERGTKNSEFRVIPMNSQLKSFLERLKQENQPKSDNEKVISILSAKRCIETACKKLGFPKFTHHSFRHMFATRCIEAGVPVPTVAKWLGHKDGGALAMKVYGHLQSDHSAAMAQRVTFGGVQ